MVKPGDSWVFQYPPSWKPPNLSCTAVSHEPKKQGLMPSCVNSGSPLSPSLAGFTVSGIHQTNASTGSICDLPCHFRTIPPALNPYFKENASLVSHEQRNSTLASPEKKFLVFDQSEKGTMLIYGSYSPPFQKFEVLRKKPCEKFQVDKGAHPANSTQFELDDLIFREESGENHIDSEESVMREDTEEINALLYSDDDEEDGDEEDEVTSTGHTPSVVVQCCGKRGHVEDRSDEVGNFIPLNNKRLKPIGSERNGFNSSPMETPSIKFGGSSEHESDADSSFVMSQDKMEDKLPALGGEFSKTDKIRQMMKILEGIVPGAEAKDPVVILDEAIEYLKTMRLKAKVLGMSFH